MPAVIPKSGKISIALLEELDKFIEENYIPLESIPANTPFLPNLDIVQKSISPQKVKDENHI